MNRAPVSVIIPTWRRLDALKKTLRVLQAATPKASEIIVHVDAGDTETAPWLKSCRPDVRVLTSTLQVGPGGGRNRLIAAAQYPYVASFDDDSYPLDADYFARLVASFARHPKAGIIASGIFHRGETVHPAYDTSYQAADFVGCGCAYRRSAWKDFSGYLPLPIAYGAEERDVALQCLDTGWSVMKDCRLRVKHDTDLKHHLDAKKTAGAIVNRLLLAYVRYPAAYWPLGVAQYIKRIVWSVQSGRSAGVVTGIFATVPTLWKYRSARNPVSPEALKAYRALQKGISDARGALG